MSEYPESDVDRTRNNSEVNHLYRIYSNQLLADRIGDIERVLNIVDERHQLKDLLNPSRSQNRPYHRWSRYREAYSGQLVKELIARCDLDPDCSFIFDPMCGSGTTLVAAAEMGFDALGSDINPYSVDLSNAKVATYTTQSIRTIQDFIETHMPGQIQQTLTSYKAMESVKPYFQPQHLERVQMIRDAIETVNDPAARQLLFVAWLTILEDCSERRRSGNGLVTRRSPVRDVWHHFVSRVRMFVDDIMNHALPKRVTASAMKISAFRARSAAERFLQTIDKELGAIIFSPPYANSFDYFESYKLELLADYYDIDGLAEARQSAIRNYRKGYGYQLTSQDELVQMLCEEVSAKIPMKEARMGRIDSRSRLVPNLLIGYFTDMEKVLIELHSFMPRGSSCHIVVNQSSYLGVVVPTDIVLANIAIRHGFDVVQVSNCGKATTSAQQLRRYPHVKKMLRKAIVWLTKP